MNQPPLSLPIIRKMYAVFSLVWQCTQTCFQILIKFHIFQKNYDFDFSRKNFLSFKLFLRNRYKDMNAYVRT